MDFRPGESDDAILSYVPDYKRISGFDLSLAQEAVAESLKFAGYKGKPEDLFQTGVLELILSAVKNNPRRFLLYLLDLTKLAFNKKQASIPLTLAQEFLAEKFAEPVPKLKQPATVFSLEQFITPNAQLRRLYMSPFIHGEGGKSRRVVLHHRLFHFSLSIMPRNKAFLKVFGLFYPDVDL